MWIGFSWSTMSISLPPLRAELAAQRGLNVRHGWPRIVLRPNARVCWAVKEKSRRQLEGKAGDGKEGVAGWRKASTVGEEEELGESINQREEPISGTAAVAAVLRRHTAKLRMMTARKQICEECRLKSGKKYICIFSWSSAPVLILMNDSRREGESEKKKKKKIESKQRLSRRKCSKAVELGWAPALSLKSSVKEKRIVCVCVFQ